MIAHGGTAMGSTMELRPIRYLLEVTRRGGFTRAAESLQIAQSALSVAVRRLEQEPA